MRIGSEIPFKIRITVIFSGDKFDKTNYISVRISLLYFNAEYGVLSVKCK